MTLDRLQQMAKRVRARRRLRELTKVIVGRRVNNASPAPVETPTAVINAQQVVLNVSALAIQVEQQQINLTLSPTVDLRPTIDLRPVINVAPAPLRAEPIIQVMPAEVQLVRAIVEMPTLPTPQVINQVTVQPAEIGEIRAIVQMPEVQEQAKPKVKTITIDSPVSGKYVGTVTEK